MSFKWKGLLGVGGGGASGAAGAAGSQAALLGATGVGAHEPWAALTDEWHDSLDPFDLPNMLGLENFGNTCYVNSVMQALYFCDPFREALLTYGVATRKTAAGEGADEGANTHDESTVESSTTVKQQLQPPQQPQPPQQASFVTLFDALRVLFQRMAAASVEVGKADNAIPPPSTPTVPTSSSYLGSGLSRKVSSRPGTASGKQGGAGSAGGIAAAGTSGGIAGAQSGATVKGGRNMCSNIVVPDADIKAFLGSLKKSNILFDSTAHQDAHELLNFVLNRIGEDIVEEAKGGGAAESNGIQGVGPDGKTLVQRLFEGTLTNETRCLTCESVTSRDECFLDLSLDIERNSSVTACLRQFSASEMLCARNKFFCDTCSGLQEAEKRMKIKRLPNVLALHLKRFKYEESVQRFVKLAYRVVFPMQLRLVNTSSDADDPDKLYELYGIIVHMGAGPHHGHYVAIIKVGIRWFVFDDETISVIDESDLARYYGDTPGSGSAYVLFYQAVDLDMHSLGLPDLKTMREEKMRSRREAAVLQQLNAFKQDHQLQRTSSHNGVLLGAGGPFQDGIQLPSELPSRTSTPAEGRTGLFGRRQNSTGGLAVAGVPQHFEGGTAMSNSVSEQSALTGGENKGSWLSSLRGRKGSASVHHPVAIPVAATSTNPSPDDDESRSLSASTTSNRIADDTGATLSAPDRSSWLGGSGGFTSNAMRQRSPQRLETAAAPTPPSGTSPNKTIGLRHSAKDLKARSTSPPSLPATIAAGDAVTTQGAAFMPADRPLSKKEQDKIAKHAARQSRTPSVSYTHSQSPFPAPASATSSSTATPQTTPQQHVQPLPLVADPLDVIPPSATGWRRMANVSGSSPRRPSTADPSMDGAKATRRRSTLSRAFGIGRKEKS